MAPLLPQSLKDGFKNFFQVSHVTYPSYSFNFKSYTYGVRAYNFIIKRADIGIYYIPNTVLRRHTHTRNMIFKKINSFYYRSNTHSLQEKIVGQ